MNVPVKLVKEVVAKEAGGNWGDPTVTKYRVFAELLEPSSAFRSYDAQTQLGQVQKFKIRKTSLAVTGDWKIEFRGELWTIQSIEGDSFYQVITANHK